MSTIKNNGDGTVTVSPEHTIDYSTPYFTPYTVGTPINTIVLSCGHQFKIGADETGYRAVLHEANHVQDTFRLNTYNCIRCQKVVDIVSWENDPRAANPLVFESRVLKPLKI